MGWGIQLMEGARDHCPSFQGRFKTAQRGRLFRKFFGISDRLPARVYRQEMTQRFQAWREVTGTAVAA
jgi:hypothetical protein